MKYKVLVYRPDRVVPDEFHYEGDVSLSYVMTSLPVKFYGDTGLTVRYKSIKTNGCVEHVIMPREFAMKCTLGVTEIKEDKCLTTQELI